MSQEIDSLFSDEGFPHFCTLPPPVIISSNKNFFVDASERRFGMLLMPAFSDLFMRVGLFAVLEFICISSNITEPEDHDIAIQT